MENSKIKKIVTSATEISSQDETNELSKILDSIENSDWKEYTDGSERMVFWTTGPYARLAREIATALYCMASDGTDTKLFTEGAEFLNSTINNCLEVFGSDARIEVKTEEFSFARPASKQLS